MNLTEAIIIVALTVILGLGGVIYVQHTAITGLRGQVLTLTDQKAKADGENAHWKVVSDNQNDAISKLMEEARQRDAAAAKAISAAAVGRDAKNLKAASLLALQVDPNDCKGAVQVKDNFLRSRK